MNCSVGTCSRTAEVREPLPLCGTCALRVIAAYADANLSAGSGTTQVRQSEQTGPKAVRRFQDAVTLSLYLQLNRRPEWTEIVDALTAARLQAVSRPTAQRIRERVEYDNPDLPRERPALTGTN